jgi:hypothetical protein
LKWVGRVAQLVEQRPFKAWVAGSIPAALTKICRWSLVVSRWQSRFAND